MKSVRLLVSVPAGLCAACTLLAAPLQDPANPPAQHLPEGSGVAARHPGDAGIEQDAAVLFAENFESGTIPDLGRKWQDVGNKDKEVLAFSTDVPVGSPGKRSLAMTATLGKNSGGYLYTSFAGVDRAFLRFYTKFAPDAAYEHHFVELGGYNPPLRWPFPHAGTRPKGDERVLCFIDPIGEYGKYPAPGIWQLYTYWPEMNVSADNHYWGNCLRPPTPNLVPRGRWQCVELMIKLNAAPNAHDGELALWLDGKLVMHAYKGVPRGEWSGMGLDVLQSGGTPFEGLRLRTDNALKINHLWLEHYTDEGAQQQNKLGRPNAVTRVWFDDIVVSTEYVGPIVTRS